MPTRSRATTRRIAMLAYDRANTVDIAGPLEVFTTASLLLAEQGVRPRAYETELLSARKRSIRTSSGIRMVCDRRFDEAETPHTLLVAGGDWTGLLEDAPLLAWLRSTRRKAHRVGSVCTGAFLLAAAGLLDRRRATTHWRFAADLASFRPLVRIEPDALFVRDGKIHTSAGVTAGMDLALALVEADHGRELALSVARHLVVFLKRPGGQSQFSSELAAQSVREEGPLRGLPEWILGHLEEDLSVERLAERVAMSPRNFARVFLREAGMTPAKYVERARVDRARRVLEDSDAPIEDVADRCGFGTAERMRRTFQRHLRVVPSHYRQRFERCA